MSSNVKFNILNHTVVNTDATPNLESTTLERLRKLSIERQDDSKEVKEYLGVVLATRIVTHPDDGFTEKEQADLLHSGETKVKGYVKCIVRIPELHACIPEPQKPTYNQGDPHFDDFYIHMHDEFFVANNVQTPMPGDIVVCDYKYRSLRKGGKIEAVHKDEAAKGGAMISSKSIEAGRQAFEEQKSKLPPGSLVAKKIKPPYDSKSSSQLTEQEKLDSLAPAFKAKVEKILAEMRKLYPETVITSPWRNIVTQRRLSGKTKTGLNFSYHISISEPDDDDNYVPVGHACDMSVSGIPNNTPEKDQFFYTLGQVVKSQGLAWGGDFPARPGKDSPYKLERWKGTPRIGWDPVHFVNKNRMTRAEKKKLKDDTGRIYNAIGIRNNIKG